MKRALALTVAILASLAVTVGTADADAAPLNPTLCAQAKANQNIVHVFVAAYTNAQAGLSVDSQRYRDLQAAINALNAGLPAFVAAEIKYC